MTINLLCANCNFSNAVRDELGGNSFPCEKCGTDIFVTPADSTAFESGVQNQIPFNDGVFAINTSSPGRSFKKEKVPSGVKVSIAAIVILMCFNLAAMRFASSLPSLFVFLVRLVIQAWVIYGLNLQQSRIRLAATAMAGMMIAVLTTLLVVNCLDPDEQLISDEQGLLVVLFLLCAQIACEISVIAGLNVQTSRKYLSK